ncbi:MAG: hypothetical protein IJ494_01775 [Bacteroides sp.]|nr:hypothetical protein [Bacteroides sp.]
MNYRNRNNMPAKRIVACKRKENELPVYGNLVVTPSKMLEMSEKGIPISSQNMAFQPSDGEQNPSWDLPLDRLRGVDPAEMWEYSQVIKQRAKRAHDVDRSKFGD